MTTHPQGVLQPPVHEGDHSIGPADAPVTLVEYGDFQCPHCARAHPRVKAVRERLGDRLRFVFRNFPLTEVHPEALHAAEAAESVAAHAGNDAYWVMHDLLYEHQQDSEWALDDEHLLEYAAAAGADPAVVKADLEADTFEAHVRTDFLSGVRSGVNGTPTFFINGERFEGDWSSVSSFAAVLEAAAARSHSLNQESRA
jgi:protein-disulfide isomerase